MQKLLIVFYAQPRYLRARLRSPVSTAELNEALDAVGGRALRGGGITATAMGPIRRSRDFQEVHCLWRLQRSRSGNPFRNSPRDLRRAKELLSAALANCQASQNWLSLPTADMDRARLSIENVIRDVGELGEMLR
jgi:hypothetical protein